MVTLQSTGTSGGDHKRRLRAIMFADVVGYSRMMAEDEVETSIRVSNLIRKFEKLGRAYNGELAQTRGDGLFFLFDSVTDAVRLAAEIEKLTRKVSEKTDKTKHINFRIGVHIGDVMWVTNQYVGDSVNIASRIESQAGKGGICISSAVYEQVKHKLHLGYEYLGPLSLKNIPDPVEVYRINPSTSEVLMSASLRSDKHSANSQLDESQAKKPRIAVLPFNNVDDSNGSDFFADGVTEDLITNLSRFHSLAIISRTSTFVYKKRNVPLRQIGNELGAQYVVTGSIQQSGKRLRITVELVDCNTSIPLWRERYNREIEDIFDLQDEITNLISSAVAVQAQIAGETESRVQIPSLIETYSYVLQGQQQVSQYKSQENSRARQMFEKALESQSDYSRAAAGLSRTHNLDWRYSWSEDPEQALVLAHQLAQDSVSFDPSDARGYGELGFVSLYKKEHDRSLSSFEKALKLNPNDADIMANYADALAHCGQGTKAISLLQKALLLNPFYPDQYLWYLGGTYFALKDYERTISTLKRMNSPAEGRRLLAASYAYLGQEEDAKRETEAVLEAYPNFQLEYWRRVVPDKYEEDTEHYVEGLRMAGFR